MRAGSISLIAVLLVVAQLAWVVPASAQSAQSGSESSDIPRTIFGHPDLQGNWTNATLTPIQRPEDQDDLVLTAEEAAELEARRVQQNDSLNAPSDPNRPPPPQGGFEPGQGGAFGSGGPGTYNNVWTQKGDLIAVFNGEPRSSLIVEPEDGRLPELTPGARERQDQRRQFRAQFGPYDHPELRPLAERCIVSFGSNAGPPMLPNYAYNNNYVITQTPDQIAIVTEMVHDTRVIRLGDDLEPPPDDVRPWFGYSRGEWVGDTLVVETTNFHPMQQLMGVQAPEDMKVTERFTRADDETINYEFTVEAPSTWEQPWSGQVPFKRTEEQLYEYACHEGNYGLEGVLSGARYQERQETQQADQGENDDRR